MIRGNTRNTVSWQQVSSLTLLSIKHAPDCSRQETWMCFQRKGKRVCAHEPWDGFLHNSGGQICPVCNAQVSLGLPGRPEGKTETMAPVCRGAGCVAFHQSVKRVKHQAPIFRPEGSPSATSGQGTVAQLPSCPVDLTGLYVLAPALAPGVWKGALIFWIGLLYLPWHPSFE